MTMLSLRKELTGSILDVGGGGEGVIGRLYGPSVTIIDHCQEELDEAPCSCPKLLMDAASLAFADASFENVTFFYSLMYMNRPVQSAALAEAVRVLKPGGRLLLWDCEIACAYPEPFLAELDVRWARERVCTTYGVVKSDPQSMEDFLNLCRGNGLTLLKPPADISIWNFGNKKQAGLLLSADPLVKYFSRKSDIPGLPEP